MFIGQLSGFLNPFTSFSVDAFQITYNCYFNYKSCKLTIYKTHSYKIYDLDKGNVLLMTEENSSTLMKRWRIFSSCLSILFYPISCLYKTHHHSQTLFFLTINDLILCCWMTGRNLQTQWLNLIQAYDHELWIYLNASRQLYFKSLGHPQLYVLFFFSWLLFLTPFFLSFKPIISSSNFILWC